MGKILKLIKTYLRIRKIKQSGRLKCESCLRWVKEISFIPLVEDGIIRCEKCDKK